MFGETIIHGTSSLQNSISLSCMEAQYVAQLDRTKPISWLRQLLIELSVQQIPITIHQENSGSIEWPAGGN